MEKYIKINSKNEIIDVFFEYQKNKFNGEEIFLENVDIKKHKINNKSISTGHGGYIFQYINNEIREKTAEELDTDTDLIAVHQKIIKSMAKNYVKDNLMELDKTPTQVKTIYKTFKNQFKTINTVSVSAFYDLYDNFIAALNE